MISVFFELPLFVCFSYTVLCLSQTPLERETKSREHRCFIINIAFFCNLLDLFSTVDLTFFLNHAAAAGIVAPAGFTPRTGKTPPSSSRFFKWALDSKKPLRTSTFVLRLVLVDGATSHSWRRPAASARPGLRARQAAALVAPAAWAQLTAGRHQKSRNVKFTTVTKCTSPLYRVFSHFATATLHHKSSSVKYLNSPDCLLRTAIKDGVNSVPSSPHVPSYVVQIGGREMELDGCQHICVKSYLKPVCCPQHWGPLCLGKNYMLT